jgi:hypothetical protein
MIDFVELRRAQTEREEQRGRKALAELAQHIRKAGDRFGSPEMSLKR